LGLAIGRLTHALMRVPAAAAIERLVQEHDLEPRAAENLLQYLRDQQSAAGAVPDASTILVERVRDELGDWRVCLLSPRGGRIHAPWAMAAAARIRDRTGVEVETLWGDDGFVVRFPDVDRPPDIDLLLPDPDEVQALVVRQLGATALFAAKFRENAGRSLLLPKRRPGMRAPLWQQRKRAADLLAVAARYGSFPVLLETYRECLRDFFDMPSLVATLSDVRSRKVRVVTVDSERPSPFAASLLFSYVASFLYDGDAPLAERRAQALSVDQSQLRELIGDAELRELLDADAMEDIERQLQRLDPRFQARSPDGIHDMLLALGDLSEEEVRARTVSDAAASGVDTLLSARRLVKVRLAGELRCIAVEHASRYRDALGTPLPLGLPETLLEPVRDPLGDLALRYARTHAPFTSADFALRYGLAPEIAEQVLIRLTGEQRLLEGEFRPGGTRREWTDADVLRQLRRRSLARLRREVEPVDQAVLGRFMMVWQGIARRRQGADALLDAIEQLQGAPLAASILETEILPSRVERFSPADLDAVLAAGEVVWVGVEPLGERDGRVALYFADHAPRLLPPREVQPPAASTGSGRQALILKYLRGRGASFFVALHEAAGGGYPAETVASLWDLVWQGLITNDSLHALRAVTRPKATSRRRLDRTSPAVSFRSRRLVPPSAEGRWSLVADRATSPTAWAASMARQLLARHGVLTREAAIAEAVPGGFGLLYPVLKAMEESGRIRRGYFVAGLGATQFALPGGLDLLRSLRDAPLHSRSPQNPLSTQSLGGSADSVRSAANVSSDAGDEGETGAEVAVLSATDPANPYGATLKWYGGGQPETLEAGRGPTRSVGAIVIIVDGALAAYLARGERQLLTWLPDVEPGRSRVGRAVARALIARARSGGDSPRGMLLDEIDGAAPAVHPLAPYLREAGFNPGALGFQAPRIGREAVSRS
jgi:ATP-dependent Lhr-like helicase